MYLPAPCRNRKRRNCRANLPVTNRDEPELILPRWSVAFCHKLLNLL